VVGFDVSLDVDGAASCGLIGSGLSVQSAIVASGGAFGDPDADASCANGDGTEEAILTGPTIVRIADAAQINALLKSGFSTRVPDYRGVSPLLTSAATLPPANGFYLPTQYVGAVVLATVRDANVPWHAGWTIGGEVVAVNAFGAIAGVVTTADRGPLHGARVEAGGVSALTGPDGTFALNNVITGVTALSVSTVPADCTQPAPVSVAVTAGATSNTTVSVACASAVITTSGMVLTYMCANRFRVRNPNDAVVTVTWDVAGTSEQGTLSLPARPLGSGFSESFFETVATGTVRLFYNGTQIQVKANGGFVCAP
jgi:hypothetical protein